MREGTDGMLRQATIMAARLATGRSARSIVFVNERPAELTAILLHIGEDLSSQGHDVEITGDYRQMRLLRADVCVETVGASRTRLLLIPEIHGLGQRMMAALLDDLHSVARDGLPVGAIATGSPATLKMMGDLRSFAERLIEFRRITIP